MSTTFFVSDTHFSHANILTYEPTARAFGSVEEMNKAMINRWNNVVTNHDKVFHLGDFCFGKANIEIASRLNGQKRLVLGNHDVYPAEEYLKYFLSIYGVMFWNDCVLTHIPVHPSQLQSRSKYNICGHLHSKYIFVPNGDGEVDMRYKIVSVEQINLTPISADELFK